MKIDTAMIMAAGLGTRMQPLTHDRPKPLIEVADKTLLGHCLDQMASADIKNIVINVHYKAHMVEQYMDHVTEFSNIIISDERELLLETGGGLIKAQPHLGDKPFLCLNSDNIWTNGQENAIMKLSQQWDDEKMDALLLLVPKSQAYCHTGAGDFSLADDGKIIRRGHDDTAPYIFTGIQIISHRLLRDAPKGPFSTNILWDRGIAEGRIFGTLHDAKWFDIGTPKAIDVVEDILASA